MSASFVLICLFFLIRFDNYNNINFGCDDVDVDFFSVFFFFWRLLYLAQLYKNM